MPTTGARSIRKTRICYRFDRADPGHRSIAKVPARAVGVNVSAMYKDTNASDPDAATDQTMIISAYEPVQWGAQSLYWNNWDGVNPASDHAVQSKGHNHCNQSWKAAGRKDKATVSRKDCGA